ncbi:PTS mannose/fructose/sorbose transporter subunit IIAB [Pseudolactococcus yaeyamensis]
MRNIVLISHGSMARGVRASLEMIIGHQDYLHVVELPEDGDDIQFENALNDKMKALNGSTLIIADLLGGTPCNVALKHYSDLSTVDVIAGMSLPLVLEAAVNETLTVDGLVSLGQQSVVNAKGALKEVTTKETEQLDLSEFEAYQGKANIVNTRIDERLIHGQVAGIWTTSLNTQRIIVINDAAATDPLQKSSLRMAAPSTMRLSVLSVAKAAETINSGKYGLQRLFLLFKNPTDVLAFINAGGQLETLNVGNMSYKEGSKEVTKSIKIMPEEEKVFKEISGKGINISAQLVPSEPSIDFMAKLNKI